MYDKMAPGFVKILTIALFSEQERRMCQPILETERTIVAFRARRTNFVKGTVLAFAAIRAVHFHSVVVITHIVHLLSYFIVVSGIT
jgi:hypothetical protein